jgi:NAD(P)-dependent dehydrogenase (short-subunit alcohol dehydrogenase family)
MGLDALLWLVTVVPRSKMAKYHTQSALGLSKLANILHVKHLQERLESQKVDILCVSVDPGVIATELITRWINGTPYLILRSILWVIVFLLFASPRQGAMNSAYAAASPEVKARGKAFKGAYLTPIGRIAAPTKYARDERLAQELYDTSMDILTQMDLI